MMPFIEFSFLRMRLALTLLAAQFAGVLSRMFNLGAGAAWTGKIGRTLYPSIVSSLTRRLTYRIIIVGTNGKTTTSAMIAHILSRAGMQVVSNETGANLYNGIAGSLIQQTEKSGRGGTSVGVFEVDEAEFSHIAPEIHPTHVVMLNLFRDQLDRYGEIDTIASAWKTTLSKLSEAATLIVNADDPLIASIGSKYSGRVFYFGVDTVGKKGIPDATADSIYCVSCGHGLSYHGISYSHIGDWYCASCGSHRPNRTLSKTINPLEGTYNYYNALAASLVTQTVGIDQSDVQTYLSSFKPVFGRQEEIIYDGIYIKMLLSKNPAGFNESMRAILSYEKHPVCILALNDRVLDGTDVSWIWDTDIESLVRNASHIICTGDRAWEMGMRVKYASILPLKKLTIEPDMQKAIDGGRLRTGGKKRLNILPTYSAMLDMRKILTGRKI